MIDQKTLKSLIKLMLENDLIELDLADGDEKVRLKRGSGASSVHDVPTFAASGPTTPSALPSPAIPGTGTENGPGGDDGLVPIASPMVGTFYAASNPDSEPFVQVGQRVDPDTVVCIIEAMKVFNEIKADVAGAIEKILIENGQAVEFGQPLFLVRPT